MSNQRAFVAIRADHYGDIGMPEHLAKFYYLVSTSKKQHIANLNTLTESNRRLLTLYSEAREMVRIATAGYHAFDIPTAKDLCYACTNISATIVERLIKTNDIPVIFAYDRPDLAEKLTALSQGASPERLIRGKGGVFSFLTAGEPGKFYLYNNFPKPRTDLIFG